MRTDDVELDDLLMLASAWARTNGYVGAYLVADERTCVVSVGSGPLGVTGLHKSATGPTFADAKRELSRQLRYDLSDREPGAVVDLTLRRIERQAREVLP